MGVHFFPFECLSEVELKEMKIYLIECLYTIRFELRMLSLEICLEICVCVCVGGGGGGGGGEGVIFNIKLKNFFGFFYYIF